MTAVQGAKELNKFFQNLSSAIGTAWEEVLLDNAQRVSTPLVTQMLNQIGLDETTTTPFKLFDNGCGAGVVASELQRRINPSILKDSSILCGDFSSQAIDLVNKRIEAEKWVNTTASVIDGQNPPLRPSTYTHVLSNITYHIIPDSSLALSQSIRLLSPRGILAFTTWTSPLGWAPDVQQAFASFPFPAPFVAHPQTTPWGKWDNPNWIRKTLEESGLKEVKVEPFAFLQRVDGAEYFMRNFGMIIDWVRKSCWGEEEREKYGRDEVEGLVKRYLEERYEGGGWDLVWVGLICSGRKE